ncbi:GntR family transcriptional regulator [Roseomonas sp. E05]|uniref:GntR family transcriptional regulator n=1 Tax=Roseomonas sp. E05 TaxID=3046310 RepID=UPI0024BA2C91|nr:GntR family transcriptional regulator [Roseomonas sp. E05]MDJ0388889.1 GntR family transcriptional regulator [Roseomonas sp. E05]
MSSAPPPEAAETDLALGRTIYQRVHERLRNDILAGRIPPGGRLKIADIARRHGLSQMPVREALQQLQGEGLVILSPNRGARVRAMDAAFIRSLFDIREALEGFLTRQAAACLTPALIEQLRGLQRRYDAAVESGDLRACSPLNREFHEAILRATGNHEAIRLLNQHTALIAALRGRAGYAPGRLATIRQEHWALIEALERGDGAAAQRVHAAHVRRAAEDMLAMLRAAAPVLLPEARTRAGLLRRA